VRSEQSLAKRRGDGETKGREREYLEKDRERIPMATHDHRSAGCMLLESASFPAWRWSVCEGGSALVELVTESSLLVLLVGAEAEEQLHSAEVCEQRDQS
jgi:hypothetical protein